MYYTSSAQLVVIGMKQIVIIILTDAEKSAIVSEGLLHFVKLDYILLKFAFSFAAENSVC